MTLSRLRRQSGDIAVIGIPNANVFLVPVFARAIKSRPCNVGCSTDLYMIQGKSKNQNRCFQFQILHSFMLSCSCSNIINIFKYRTYDRRCSADVFSFSTGCKVQIDAPALQYLTISAWNWADEFVMKESYSLIEVKLTYAFRNAVVTAYQPYNVHKLIKAVDMAHFLIVSIDYVEAIKSGIGVFPSFVHLTRLEMDINCCDLSVLQCFLENTVNLQYLVIRKGSKSCGVEEKWWNEQASVSKYVLSALRSAEILVVVGCTDEVALIEYILKNAKVLERITIQNSHLELWNGHQLLRKILSFPRASTKCEVSFS